MSPSFNQVLSMKQESGPLSAISRVSVSLLFAGALSSCAPLFEPAHGTSSSCAWRCGTHNFRSDSLLRTAREVRQGEQVESAHTWSDVPYRGWTVSRIDNDGVELRSPGGTDNRTFLPYGYSNTLQSRGIDPYFETTLVFEKGSAPGTAVMAIVERLF